MNFGKGITIFIICFVGFILTLVFMTFQHDVPLVADDYYKQEIEYQKTIDGQRELNKKGELIFLQQDKTINIQFPFKGREVKGSITWICFNNQHNDFTSEIEVDEDGVMMVNLPDSINGSFKMKSEFTVDGNKYFDQQEMEIK